MQSQHERLLKEECDSTESVDVKYGWEVVDMIEDEGFVDIHLENVEGDDDDGAGKKKEEEKNVKTRMIARGKYLCACDGSKHFKSSFSCMDN
tara:strand:+ start:615 stop:890 length:276 start_codon:yes stop_codon:yes gene_type:complete